MNIPSAASSRRATLEAKRLEVINLINNSAGMGYSEVIVHGVNPLVLDEVKVQGYEVTSQPHRGDGYYLIRW